MKIANRKLQFFFCILPLLLPAGCNGCREPTTSKPAESATAAASDQYREELLTYAIDNLNRLEEFSSADTLQQIFQRLDPRNRPGPGQPDKHFDPLLAAWPEPEMLRQVVDRLNQWIRTQQPPADWKLDPMAAALPKPLADLPQVEDLGRMEFSRFDGYVLQEAVWLRDVCRWARGDVLDDLERAKSLFDWTVRNIQLEADDADGIPQFPWETLFFGRGTVAERAWVFILLLRQLDIDAAVLALDKGRGARGEGREQRGEGRGEKNAPGLRSGWARDEVDLRPWCVGVLIEDDVYLFDPLLGLPIPAPGGVKLDRTGQLAIQPATLAQAVADDELLRRLDVDETRAYGVKASDLTRVTALLEASPSYLSRRMKLLESHLAGARKMVLTTSPTRQAQRWTATADVAEARLWLRPFETLERRRRLDWDEVRVRLAAMRPFYWIYEERSTSPGKEQPRQRVVRAAVLGKGRILQLKGKFVGEDGAIHYYQMARPSNRKLLLSSAPLKDKLIRIRGKYDASYWSGLIAYQRGNYAAAIDYFTKRTLLAYPNGPWTNGARYNLARAYEAFGQTERAVLQYGSNASSPGYLGDLLRAKWLQTVSN